MSLTLEEIQNFKGKYPKQIWSLFFSEMWERFCFYGMRGMLVFFMISQLNFHEREANLQYGATQAFVYAFTFVGGLFADKILGFRKSLFWGGLLMIVGSLILAADPHKFFFLGIAFTVVGTGFFINLMILELMRVFHCSMQESTWGRCLADIYVLPLEKGKFLAKSFLKI
jgi:POT family proton-dependent oligopeptide transporter